MLAPDKTAAPTKGVDFDYSITIIGRRPDDHGYRIGPWEHVIEAPCGNTQSTAKVAQVSIDADIAKAGRAFVRALERRGGLADGIMGREVKAFLQDGKKRVERRDMFSVFVSMLLHMICNLGGDVSVNRNKGTGNVIDLLEYLRPHMPPGVIPNALPWPNIERICTRIRAVRPVKSIACDILLRCYIKSAPHCHVPSDIQSYRIAIGPFLDFFELDGRGRVLVSRSPELLQKGNSFPQ